MPDGYLTLTTHLKEIVHDAEADITNGERIRVTIVHSTELQHSLLAELSDPMDDATELTTALHVLHDLGDILWFDSGVGILSKTVFLSPKFTINFVRQVVNHKLVDEAYIATMNDRWRDLYNRVREEGCVEHELLKRLQLWREVDDIDLLLELKLVMFELQLTSPVGVDGMRVDSDLIVPLYWKKTAASSTVFGSDSVINTSWLYRVRWECKFQEHLPEDCFEKLDVQSYSLYYSADREFSQDAFKSAVIDEYETIIRKKHAGAEDEWECDIVTLSVGVVASEERVTWQQLMWYAMKIEKLLETYPGLWVKQYAVSPSGKRFALDHLVSQMQRTKVCPSRGLLPSSMEWHTSRVWQRCSDVVTSLPHSTDDRQPMSSFEQFIIDNVTSRLSSVQASET